MNRGTWWDSGRRIFLDKMSRPFQSFSTESSRSSASKRRETSVETLMSRITPQILESYEKGLSWTTPEEWDHNFDILGGGQSRRRSSRILKRMSWDCFIELSNKIILNRTNPED